MPARTPLRVLCANIQAGATTRHSLDYLKGWKLWLPFGKQENLEAVAHLAQEHDLVGLQEADGGSLRSGFACQAGAIGALAQMPHSYRQVNREIGPIMASGNAVLGRFCPRDIQSIPLPSKIPGRGVLLAEYAMKNGSWLTVVVAHLSLSTSARTEQMKVIAKLIKHAPHPVVMGDLNCPLEAPELQGLMKRAGLVAPPCVPPTYPAWAPTRAIDHILVGGGIRCDHISALRIGGSDHLALSAQLSLPSGLVPPKN